MTAIDVQNIIIEPMTALYAQPIGIATPDREKTALRQYIDALQSFEAVELTEAWKQVREAHLKVQWPPIGMIIKLAALARRTVRKAATKGQTSDEIERRQRWDQWLIVRNSDLGRMAAREGWSWSLKCEILDGKKMADIDPARMRETHHRCNALAIDLGNGPDWKGREECLRMWDGICVRSAETAQEISGRDRGFT